MNPLLTVVISQGQSRRPELRQLEQTLAEAAAQIDNTQVLLIPHLYDLKADGESLARLRAIPGDLVVVAWGYRRATHWIMDRNGVRGRWADVALVGAEERDSQETDDDDEAAAEQASQQEASQRVADLSPRPARFIYTLDFRASDSAEAFIEEVRRIADLPRSQPETPSHAQANEKLGQQQSAAATHGDVNQRDVNPTHALSASSGLALAGDLHEVRPTPSENYKASKPTSQPSQASRSDQPSDPGVTALQRINEAAGRRWYPVIDFSRCTNCMECIDFCLFGVYGVDTIDTILVEQPDNCRKGCPACSRVCPENAIIFPQHKSPGIAGAPVEVGGLKIDLSKLFGGDNTDHADGDALATAARERDEQLLLAGRPAVGIDQSTDRRKENRPDQPKDQLDGLLDELEQLDL